METNSFVKNIPNAAKLISSLRHLDYNNIKALADIIDNSIDANASHIWIDIIPKKEKAKEESEIGTIIIADNGKGMDNDTLDEAMKLGSDTFKNASYDLGLYGMGLITSSISIGEKLTVLTKEANGELYKSIQDLELIYKENEFIKILEAGNEEDLKLLQSKILNPNLKNKDIQITTDQSSKYVSGTVVILDNLDNLDYNTINGFVNSLHRELGQVYRKFITAGTIKIFIQGSEVKAIDPVYDYEPMILNEEEIKFPEGSIKLTIAELKDYGQAINREKKINIPNQGFYVLRNNREILCGESFGIFTKHNDFNTLRIEFSYPGSLDKILSLNFSKSKISLNQSISDKIEKICNPFIKQVRARAKARQSPNASEEDFSEIEKYITQKSHLLKRPEAEIEKRNAPQKNLNTLKVEAGKNSPRLDLIKKKRITIENLKVKFKSKSLNERGPVYDTDMERDTIIIYWNVDHPFYKHFIEKNVGNPDVVNPIYFLVYSLGNAELISGIDSDTMEIITNIRYDVGRNLAVLLKD